MKHPLRPALFALTLSLPALSANADSAPSLTPAPVDTLALYKNGTALVVRRVEPPADSSPVLLDGRIAPAHGTFWTDSPTPLSFLADTRRIALPPGTPSDISVRPASCGSRKATVWFRVPAAVAESLQACADGDDERRIDLSAPAGDHLVDLPLRGTVLSPAPAAAAMSLRLANGTIVRAPDSAVAAVLAEGPASADDGTADLPVLEVAGAAAPFRLSYLAPGAAWAPSYRISVLPSAPTATTARIEMAAEIRNELEDLSGVRLFLVSGYPNLEAASIPGLLAAGNTLPAFLDALSTPPAERNRGRGWNTQRPMLSQIAWTANAAMQDKSGLPDALPDVLPEAAAADIHYRYAGPLTLAKGATLRLPLDTADAPAERFVDWEPGWKYDEYGRRQKDDLEEQRVPWDAIRFHNPFDAPLTTGPAFVFDASKPLLADDAPAADRPLGQTTLRWTNPGQEAVLRVTKALSVATTFDETIPGRIEDYPKVAWLDNIPRYRRVEIEATLTAVNHRTDPVTLVIRPTILDEFQSATIQPNSVLTEGSREARSDQPNPTQKLRWTLPLAPGETLSLSYRYTTLVRI
jgi:hypothetical protein